MSTSAQVAANQQNALHSTGPKTEQGKAVSSLNNFRHGFTGAFCVLDWEDGEQYKILYVGLLDDHLPASTTEHLLVQTMAQSAWLKQRALTLQQMCFDPALPMCQEMFEKQLALYLRYQTTHDRAFYKALGQLIKLREGERKEQIGFESQNRKQAAQQALEQRREAGEKRREAAENRAQEMHHARLWLTEAKAERHQTENTIAQAVKTTKSDSSQLTKAA